MHQNRRKIEQIYNELPDSTKEYLDQAIRSIVSTKKKKGRWLLLRAADLTCMKE